MSINPQVMVPVRSMYVVATAILAVFIIGFAWFACAMLVEKVAVAALPIISEHGSNPAYTTFLYAQQFLDILWKSLPAIVLIGILFWAVIYSQRKGEIMQ